MKKHDVIDVDDEDEKDEDDEDKDPELLQPEQRMDNSADYLRFLVTPTVPNPESSDVMRFVSKDMAVSYLNDSDIRIVLMLYQLATMFDFVGLRDMAHIYHGDMVAFLTSCRSRGGFERQEQTKVRQIVEKITGEKRNFFEK